MKTEFHNTFKFLDWRLDNNAHCLYLSYELENVGKVTEVLTFPAFKEQWNQNRQDAINNTCQLLHYMCGVSYYKAGMASKIIYNKQQPSEQMAGFLEKTWKNGLAEMAFINNISLKDRCKFTFNEQKFHSDKLILKNQSLVAIGGGKDSLVTIEALRNQGIDICLFFVGNAKLIKDVIKATGLSSIQVTRKIDEKLINYNKQGAFNGHIPITAINSSIAVLTALLFDFSTIVFSNERSADSANTINSDGESVNHQYSKSYEFERDLQKIIQVGITSSLRYYSYLRFYSELAILKKFSDLNQYFNVFSSCNRNFHIDGSHNKLNHWCCDCPKCRFVFLGMAAFASQDEVVVIFGKNMLDNESQIQGFSELLGLHGIKPFECVGTIEESQLAMSLIASKPEWQKSKLVNYFTSKIPQFSQENYDKIMITHEVS